MAAVKGAVKAAEAKAVVAAAVGTAEAVMAVMTAAC